VGIIQNIARCPLLKFHDGSTIMELLWYGKSSFVPKNVFLWVAKSKWVHNRGEKGKESEVVNELDSKIKSDFD
jgi:hypothetical protein